MVIKKESRRAHNPVKVSSSEAAAHAAHLAPPEEQRAAKTDQGPDSEGAVIFDTGKLALPQGFSDEEKRGSGLLGFNPVVLFILIFALAFIGFIAYMISIETPTK